MSSISHSCNAILICAVLLGATAPLAATPACTASRISPVRLLGRRLGRFATATGERDAHVRVDRILDGCVLREQYDGANGHRGQSFSIYDSSRQIWDQSWVTNRGELLTIEGNLQGKAMVSVAAILHRQASSSSSVAIGSRLPAAFARAL